jgi:hypothetical protein
MKTSDQIGHLWHAQVRDYEVVSEGVVSKANYMNYFG